MERLGRWKAELGNLSLYSSHLMTNKYQRLFIFLSFLFTDLLSKLILQMIFLALLFLIGRILHVKKRIFVDFLFLTQCFIYEKDIIIRKENRKRLNDFFSISFHEFLTFYAFADTMFSIYFQVAL